MILLDEPAGGLDTTESQWLGDRLRAVRDSGTTIVIIDHDMSLVLDLCDQICVLDFGRIIAQGPPELVRSVAPLRSGQPVAANRQGLIHVPDDRVLFTTLSVRENLTLARRKGGPDLDDTVELFPALAKRWTLAAGSLSGGEQHLEVADHAILLVHGDIARAGTADDLAADAAALEAAYLGGRVA